MLPTDNNKTLVQEAGRRRCSIWFFVYLY